MSEQTQAGPRRPAPPAVTIPIRFEPEADDELAVGSMPRRAKTSSSALRWTEVKDVELVRLLHGSRMLAGEGDHLRVLATPAPPLEQVHVLVTENDTGGMCFPTIRHYALAPMLSPEVRALRVECDCVSFDLSFETSRGRKTTQVEVHEASFDIWGVRFEDRTNLSDAVELLHEVTPRWISCDDEDLDEEALPPGTLVARVFDWRERALVRWMGGGWRYVPVLYVTIAHGEGDARVERAFASPMLDEFFLHDLRRHDAGSLSLELSFRPFDEERVFSSNYARRRVRFVIDAGGLTPVVD